MSAIVERLELRNLECYRRAEVDFSAGLNLIRGRNSTGKTTLLNALTFALFGEVPEIDKRLLFSRLPGSGEMIVRIRFRSPKTGEIVEVERSGVLDKDGNYRTERRSLKVGGKTILVESEDDLKLKVAELLGVGLRNFFNLVYVRQGRLNEILRPQRDQMDFILGITLLRELREQFDEAGKSLERFENRDVATEIRGLEERISDWESSLRQVCSDVERLGGDVEKLQDVLRRAESRELNDLLSNIDRKEVLETRIRNCRLIIDHTLEQEKASSVEELEEKVSALQRRIKELKSRGEELEKRVEKDLLELSEIRGLVKTLEDDAGKYEALVRKGVSKCPTCGQDIRPELLKQMLEEKRRLLVENMLKEDEAKRICEKENTELKRVLDEERVLEGEALRLSSVVKSLREQSASLQTYEKSIGETLLVIGRMLSGLSLPFSPEDPQLKLKIAQRLPLQPEELAIRRKELEEKKRELDRKVQMKRELEERLGKSRKMLGELKNRLDKAELARKVSRFLEQAVEARRRELLRRIEHRALEYYKIMTDQHVYDAIMVNPEDYSVWVHQRGLTEQIPATRVGGGHQTLISLAVRLALIDALGLKLLLILDEPTYGVDSENLPQVANYLGEISKLIPQMILVTHHNICEEEASNIIEVTVQEDGSSKAEVKT